MLFKQTSCGIGWGVKAEHDSISMLQSRVEGVADVHEECIAVPLEVILYERIRESSAMEEICGCSLDGVTGP